MFILLSSENIVFTIFSCIIKNPIVLVWNYHLPFLSNIITQVNSTPLHSLLFQLILQIDSKKLIITTGLRTQIKLFCILNFFYQKLRTIMRILCDIFNKKISFQKWIFFILWYLNHNFTPLCEARFTQEKYLS